MLVLLQSNEFNYSGNERRERVFWNRWSLADKPFQPSLPARYYSVRPEPTATLRIQHVLTATPGGPTVKLEQAFS
jgi:hypothetical protein